MKSFDEKLDFQFSNLSFEKPNIPQYIEHIYADYVELIALFYKEEVTIADISDRLLDVKDHNISETSIREIETEEIASLASEKNDEIDDKIIAFFGICKERFLMFEPDEYPYVVKEREIQLKKDLTEKQRIYLFLLLSSSLNYFKILNAELTKDFELLSYFSLKSFLPFKSIVKSFGKNSEYIGNAITKITLLSEDLGLKLNTERVDCISKKNSKERGLDLIAWIPFNDRNPNMLILLGQCACGKDWDMKQSDTEFFKSYFYFKKSPLYIMFIPYALGNSERSFYQEDRILDNLFFDRKRIVEQFENTDFFKTLLTYNFVENCIKIRMDPE